MTSYVWFNLVMNKSSFTRSRDIHPRDLVTRCAALWMESHQVGPEYLSITWIDKSRSCNNTPQHISTEYPRYNLLTPVFGTTTFIFKMASNKKVFYRKTLGIIDMNIFVVQAIVIRFHLGGRNYVGSDRILAFQILLCQLGLQDIIKWKTVLHGAASSRQTGRF